MASRSHEGQPSAVSSPVKAWNCDRSREVERRCSRRNARKHLEAGWVEEGLSDTWNTSSSLNRASHPSERTSQTFQAASRSVKRETRRWNSFVKPWNFTSRVFARTANRYRRLTPSWNASPSETRRPTRPLPLGGNRCPFIVGATISRAVAAAERQTLGGATDSHGKAAARTNGANRAKS